MAAASGLGPDSSDVFISERGEGQSGSGGSFGSTGGARCRCPGKCGGICDPERLYEQEMERRVREILRNVEGVGEVDVMITLRSSAEKVVHVDRKKSRSSTEEKDSAGGTRKLMSEEIGETSLMAGSSGAEQPVIEKELEPEISGVIISAQGGGSASVRVEISEAMEALFGLPAHKIKVLKRVE